MLHGDNVAKGTLSFRDVGNKLRTAVREFDVKSERTRLATGSFLSAVVGLPSQQSQTNDESADGSFGVATATGPTGPTFAGGGGQHTKADAPRDRRQRSGLKSDAETSAPTVCKGCGLREHNYSNYFSLSKSVPQVATLAGNYKHTLQDNTVREEQNFYLCSEYKEKSKIKPKISFSIFFRIDD
jgi:hypothetical protein